MDASSRRVSCTHDWFGRESKTSEISSIGEVGAGFATGLGVVTGFAPVLDAFLGFTAAFLGPAVFLGLMFSGVTSFAVAVTWSTFVAIVTWWGVVLGMGWELWP